MDSVERAGTEFIQKMWISEKGSALMRKKITSVLCLMVAFMSIREISSIYGQIRTGAISGTVKDASGGVLPGVTVTIKNVDTGQSRVVVTDDEGRYRAPELALGNYEVQAELVGFQTAVRAGIQLTVGREALVDFALSVGEISEKVTVTSEAPMVNTTSSTLAELIDEKQLHDLPINARNLTQLALLSPGVAQARTAPSGSQFAGSASVKISVGGARIYMTGYLLDGTDITDTSRASGVGGVAGSLFGVETMREFQVLTNNFSAQYSRFAGGMVSMVTKSGTNTLHGSVFEFFRNDNLDARNFFDPGAPPEFKRNQFGFTLGGPIIKDRSFFFGSYEGYRESLGLTLRATVPTLNVRQGILPDGRTITVNPAVKPFLNLYPLPTPGGRDFGQGGAEYIVGKNQPVNENFETVRIDHSFSDSDSLFGRYTQSKGDRIIPHALPGSGWVSDTGNYYLTLEEKHIFSPRLIDILRVGFSRVRWSQQPPLDSPPLSISLIPDQPLGQITPGAGISTLGLNIEGANIANTFSYGDDLFITRGGHDIKTGVNVTRYQNNDFFDYRFQGVYQFGNLERFLTGRPTTWIGQLPGSSTRRGFRQTAIGMYVQDDMKLRPNFALNLGVRYEFITTPDEVNGLVVNLRDPLHDAQSTPGFPLFENPSKKNFAPRIGVAWDPFGDGKTSVRSGFGIFHDTILFYHFANQSRRQSPLSRNVNIPNPSFPLPQISEALANAVREEHVAEFEPRQPYIMQWNLTFQRELLADTTFTVAYVGSRGVNLGGDRNVNVRIPQILPDGQKFFPVGASRRNPNFDNIFYWDFAYNSSYHGLQLSGRKKFSSGLQFQGAYTWGRCVDEESRANSGDFSGTPKEPQDPYNVKASNRGLCDHHVGQAFTFNYSYALPIKGLSGFAAKIGEGWQLNGIVSLSTGNPLQISLGSLTDWNRDGDLGFERPNVKSGRSNNPIFGGPDLYFDPTAFELQPAGFYGNVGRNTLISPGVATVDFSLMKNTALRENVNVQFRAEFFNLFNRANFGNPNSSIFANANGGFVNGVGRITTTTTTARQIQFGLRLLF